MSPRNLHTAVERLPVTLPPAPIETNDREDADNAESLVKARSSSSRPHLRYGEWKDPHNQQAAPPESTLFKPYQPAEA